MLWVGHIGVLLTGVTAHGKWICDHYNDVIMSMMASQITCVFIVCSTVGSGADQREHQNSASLAFVRGIHRWLVNSLHERPVMRKMFPFDDIIMVSECVVIRFKVCQLNSCPHTIVTHDSSTKWLIMMLWFSKHVLLSLWRKFSEKMHYLICSLGS